MLGVRFKMKYPENESRAKRENGWRLQPLELERLARRIFLEKQNSLKQLNLTREKIKNGTKREKKRKRRGRETSHSPDCLLCCSEGAWLLLRLLKQRETLRIYHIG